MVEPTKVQQAQQAQRVQQAQRDQRVQQALTEDLLMLKEQKQMLLRYLQQETLQAIHGLF